MGQIVYIKTPEQHKQKILYVEKKTRVTPDPLETLRYHGLLIISLCTKPH